MVCVTGLYATVCRDCAQVQPPIIATGARVADTTVQVRMNCSVPRSSARRNGDEPRCGPLGRRPAMWVGGRRAAWPTFPDMSVPEVSVRVRPGSPFPLGVHFVDGGVNVAVYSSVADEVLLCLFGPDGLETQYRLPRQGARGGA